MTAASVASAAPNASAGSRRGAELATHPAMRCRRPGPDRSIGHGGAAVSWRRVRHGDHHRRPAGVGELQDGDVDLELAVERRRPAVVLGGPEQRADRHLGAVEPVLDDVVPLLALVARLVLRVHRPVGLVRVLRPVVPHGERLLAGAGGLHRHAHPQPDLAIVVGHVPQRLADGRHLLLGEQQRRAVARARAGRAAGGRAIGGAAQQREQPRGQLRAVGGAVVVHGERVALDPLAPGARGRR
jgi:hypothetical protein